LRRPDDPIFGRVDPPMAEAGDRFRLYRHPVGFKETIGGNNKPRKTISING
jgi:hypothetical protein